MLRKTTAVAMAIGVVALLPATASAEWKHHSTPIQEAITVGLTGNVRFEGSIGGFECQVTSRLKFEPGTTGLVETFVPHPTNETTNCKGLGPLAFCQIHNLTPQQPNWVFHTTTVGGNAVGEVTFSSLTSQNTGAFCPLKGTKLNQGTGAGSELILTPNQPNTITSGQYQANLLGEIQTNNGTVDKETVTLSGEGQIEQEVAEHIYSI